MLKHFLAKDKACKMQSHNRNTMHLIKEMQNPWAKLTEVLGFLSLNYKSSSHVKSLIPENIQIIR